MFRAAVQVSLLVVLGLVLLWRFTPEPQRHELVQRYEVMRLIERVGLMTGLVRPAPVQSVQHTEFVELIPELPSIERMVPDDLSVHEIEASSFACRPRKALNPSRKSAREVYRWVGSDGQIVFSDQSPNPDRAQVVGQTSDGGVGMFSTDYRFIGSDPKSEFQRDLARNIDGVFRFLADNLQLRDVEPLHVTLTLVEGEGAFNAYRDSKTIGLATNSGFYTFLGNEAVVRWLGPDITMAVSRHEVTHLALGNWLGSIPLWLNEGLAEFVEHLSFRRSYAATEPPEDRLREVAQMRAQGKLPPLATFLGMNRLDWNRIGDEVTYPYAWSLVHFLMKDQRERALLGDYLNQAAEQRCTPFDHAGYLAANYPGGIRALESDWAQWLSRGRSAALTF